jgi:hypothetical protein
MRTRRAFTACLMVVGFVVLSVLADSGVTKGVATGTVAAFKAGDSISVTNDGMDPMGFSIALRESTAYEGSFSAIRAGTRVTVWYRLVGESRPVADKVRVLPDPATP